MTWDSIGTVAELIGAVGVILSLIYVGKQLKQTNLMSRSAVHVARSEVTIDWANCISGLPNMHEILAKVHYHGLVREDASETERIALGYFFVSLIGQIHMGYRQWKEGILSEEELEDIIGSSAPVMAFPYLSSAWPYIKGGYREDFLQWLEAKYDLRESR